MPASHGLGLQLKGSTPAGLEGFRLRSLPAVLTLKWPVLAKIWYLPWVVMREP